MTEFLSRSMAGSGQHAVGGHGPHLGGAVLDEHARPRRTIVPAVSIMSSMSTQRRPSTSPMTSRASTALVVALRRGACGRRPGRRRGAGRSARPPSPGRRRARRRRGRRRVLARCSSSSTGMAVRWSTGPSKKPWIWPECRSTRHHAVGAGGREHVGDELGGDRLAALGLAVLAGVAVEGADRGDALGRRPLGGVDHDQLLHDRVVDRRLAASGVWMMNTSAPRIDSPKRQCISPLANSRGWPRRAARRGASAISSASARVRAPGVELQPLLGDQLHRSSLPTSPSGLVAPDVAV